MEGFVFGRITRSRRGKLYIDDSTWGPEADSVESGYRVPIGSIHIFIGKTDGSDPKPDLEVLVETSSRRHAGPRHTFVVFVTESAEPAHLSSPWETSQKKHLRQPHAPLMEDGYMLGRSDLSDAADSTQEQKNTTQISPTSSLRTASPCSWQIQEPEHREAREICEHR